MTPSGSKVLKKKFNNFQTNEYRMMLFAHKYRNEGLFVWSRQQNLLTA